MKTRVVFALLCLVQLCFADQFWQTKRWQDWTNDEVNQILQNSPWTRTASTEADTHLSGPRQATTAALQPSRGPAIEYLIQLQSAQTLRRAIARRRQIDYGYDFGKQSDNLDAQLAAFLNKKFPDMVIVDVAFRSSSEDAVTALSNRWHNQTLEQLKPTAFLEVGGRKYPLTQFVVAGPRDLLFTFERPAKLPRKGTAVVEFRHLDGSGNPATRVRVEFKLSDMIVNGEPEL